MRDKLCLHRLYIRRGCLDISITTTGILFVHIYTHIKRVLEKKRMGRGWLHISKDYRNVVCTYCYLKRVLKKCTSPKPTAAAAIN